MKVLSLFDGMSCGQLALERAGIDVEAYYASEVDKYAIKVAKKNWPDMVQLGDVCSVTAGDLPAIDLLIGGSPCQGFSFAGKQLNFEDPRSKLFFEFVRILNECRAINQDIKFMLENVKMKKEYQDIISEYMGVEPVEINSALVSAQNRKRLYWTNIPFDMPKDQGILLGHIIETGRGVIVHNLYGGFKEKKARVFADKSPTLRTSAGGGHIPSVFYGTAHEARENSLEYVRNHSRLITPEEAEMLQTVQVGYTEGVSNTQRYKMIGNGWTVSVVSHIFKSLKNIEK